MAEKLSNCCKVHVTTQDCNAYGFFGRQLLKLLHEPIPLFFVMFRCPVVVKVIQNHCTRERVRGHFALRWEHMLHKIQAGVCDGDAQ